MKWLKGLWAKFDNLSTTKKFGIVGGVVAVFVLLYYFYTKNSNSNSTVTLQDGNTAADTSTDAVNSAANTDTSGIEQVLAQYQTEMQNEAAANQNFIQQMENAYQSQLNSVSSQVQSGGSGNLIGHAATSAVASSLSKGLSRQIDSWFGGGASVPKVTSYGVDQGNPIAASTAIGNNISIAGNDAYANFANSFENSLVGIGGSGSVSIVPITDSFSPSDSDFNWF